MPKAKNTILSVVVLIQLALSVNLVAQAADETAPINLRLNDVCAILGDTPPKFDTVFTESFLKQVPPIKLISGMKPVMTQYGKCTGATITKRVSEWSIEAEGTSDKGYIYPITLAIESKAPYRVTGFFVKPPRKIVVSFDGIIDQLKDLDGKTALWVYDVDEQKAIAGHNEHEYLPTGSTFKIYVLGALNHEIEQGRMSWSDVITIDSNYLSLPSGVTQDWPVGAPVTLHTLATQMISISDNTATDHLIHHVGRSNVESFQSHMLHKNPSLNKPFLTTRELFALKFSDNGERARNYVSSGNHVTRKKRLDTMNATVRLQDITFVGDPVLPDKVEWFASTSELCLAMSYFGWEMTEGDAEDQAAIKPAMEILAVNKGLEVDEDAFPYIGFKGGSETGVLNMTYLLKRQDGQWFALSASWTDPDKAVDLTMFSGIVSSALEVLAKY